jgi:glutamate N-acetyltransferase / amino-acid N-acetyltransferase
MIAPDLATMLVFVTTDANVAPGSLRMLASKHLGPRFNELTVDACTSTNDTVLLFASGAAGGPSIEPGDEAWPALEEAVASVGGSLARQLIADAEGASHVLVIDVEGADSEADARLVAKAIADSPLIKSAAFGGDPNPGRILQAVGASGADVRPTQIDVSIGGVDVVSGGVITPAYFVPGGPSDAAREQMVGPEILIGVRIGSGPGRSRALGCDLSYEYVRINGEYTT